MRMLISHSPTTVVHLALSAVDVADNLISPFLMMRKLRRGYVCSRTEARPRAARVYLSNVICLALRRRRRCLQPSRLCSRDVAACTSYETEHSTSQPIFNLCNSKQRRWDESLSKVWVIRINQTVWTIRYLIPVHLLYRLVSFMTSRDNLSAKSINHSIQTATFAKYRGNSCWLTKEQTQCLYTISKSKKGRM